MKKLFWWNLNTREKARRSFILAPIFGLMFLLQSNDSTLFGLDKWAVALVSTILMLLQGLYYYRKSIRKSKRS